MLAGRPSRTAEGAALLRALHQDLDDPVLFRDPLAWRVLGLDDDARAAALAAARPGSRLRTFVALRHRYADETVEAAYARGARQVVVLGAGLDTTAYRNPHADLRVLEVDHPATQAWKLERLAAAGIDAVATYVGVDLEREPLLPALGTAGFDASAPAVFVWLGVVPYLTHAATDQTLRVLGTVPGAEVVLDFASQPPERLAERVAELGESFTEPWPAPDLHAVLRDAGFTEVEEVPLPADSGGHVVRARRPA